MNRRVVIVDDGELAGRPYVYTVWGDTLLLLIRRSQVTAEVLTRAWAEYCATSQRLPHLAVVA